MKTTQADRVLAKFGANLNEAAERLGYPYKRLWNWRDRGFIPQEWHAELLAKAGELGVDLAPIDFVAHLEELAGAPDSIRKAS